MATTIKLLEAMLEEVADDIYELYNECVDSTPPAVYGTLLGIKEKIGLALESKYTPQKLRID